MAIVIDGNLGDWTPADRLENTLNQAAGYEIYGRFEGDTFYFALKSDVAIGENTTFWLNTDANPNTGTQIFGVGGNEYNVNFDSSGVPRLYTGTAGQTLVGNLTYALSGDGKTLEIALPRSLLGGPSVNSVGILIDVNDSAFLPNPYSENAYRILDREFDGVLTEWTAGQRLDAGAPVTGYEVYGKYSNKEFIFALKSDAVIGTNTTFWLDTDRNAATGHDIFGLGKYGADFNVNIGADGVARLYTGADGETFVRDIQYTIGPDGKTIEFAIPRAFVEGPGQHVTAIKMVADVNNAVFLPGDYNTDPAYTVAKPAPVIGSNGGGNAASLSVFENALLATNVTASHVDVGDINVFSIAGGLDAAKFNINATTGALSFKVAPDFELPTDSGANRIYNVNVKVTDQDGLYDTQALAITVKNVAGISYVGTAAADTKAGGVEADTLNGVNGNDKLYGLGADDKLFGLAGNDYLNGGAGNDTLNAGIGNDAMFGDLGKDTFVFNTAPNAVTNRDTITDFNHNDDTMWMENALFTKLGAAGALNAAFFRIGTKALDANDYIVYNKTTGALLYDNDGSGAHAAIQFATLSTKPVLAANDFVVI